MSLWRESVERCGTRSLVSAIIGCAASIAMVVTMELGHLTTSGVCMLAALAFSLDSDYAFAKHELALLNARFDAALARLRGKDGAE